MHCSRIRIADRLLFACMNFLLDQLDPTSCAFFFAFSLRSFALMRPYVEYECDRISKVVTFENPVKVFLRQVQCFSSKLCSNRDFKTWSASSTSLNKAVALAWRSWAVKVAQAVAS